MEKIFRWNFKGKKKQNWAARTTSGPSKPVGRQSPRPEWAARGGGPLRAAFLFLYFLKIFFYRNIFSIS